MEKEYSNVNEIIDDSIDKIIGKIYSEENREKRKRKIVDNVVAFVGGAGGTGTSTIAANVAKEISKRGLTVLVIDMNILYPIMHSFFGIEQEIKRKDLVSLINGECEVSEVVQFKGKIGVLVSNNRDIREYIDCEDSETCRHNIEAIIDTVKELVDMVIIDCPNSLESAMVNTAMYCSDSIYSVWDEGLGSIANIGRFIHNAECCGIDRYKIRVIMNKITGVYYPESIFDKLKVTLVEKLPFEASIINSSLRGELFCTSGESPSEAAKIFIGKISTLVDSIFSIAGYIDNKNTDTDEKYAVEDALEESEE